jgi:hypothetical protein
MRYGPAWIGLIQEGHSSLIERQLVRTYLMLFLVPPGCHGTRSVSLARFGCYEVRLWELAVELCGDTPPLWMELYAHDTASSLDSCGCDTLDAAVSAAEHLLSQARNQHRRRSMS